MQHLIELLDGVLQRQMTK